MQPGRKLAAAVIQAASQLKMVLLRTCKGLQPEENGGGEGNGKIVHHVVGFSDFLACLLAHLPLPLLLPRRQNCTLKPLFFVP